MVGAILTLALLSIPSRVVVNEVMANPADSSNSSSPHYPEDRNEFVELYNRSDDTIDLRGWHLTDFDATDTLQAWTDTLILGYPHVRINSTRIYPHGFALVMDPEYTDTAPRGGYIQPYRLPDRTLVLTVGNTTIGNGLTRGDTVMVLPRDSSEQSTFGLWAAGASGDAGNGLSWERVSPDAGDYDTTWLPCPDSAGCTPGRENAAAMFQNLACDQIMCYPLNYASGVAETIAVTVRNTGRVIVPEWYVRVFRDRDEDGREDEGERIARVNGQAIVPGTETTLVALWGSPEHGNQRIAAELECSGDQNTSDNRLSTKLNLAAGQSFCLQAELFGPGLAGRPETLSIMYSLPDADGVLVVKAYDLDGREKASIFEGRPSGKDGRLSWNGAGRAGAMLPTGLYVIACEYKHGKEHIFEKKPVVLARTR